MPPATPHPADPPAPRPTGRVVVVTGGEGTLGSALAAAFAAAGDEVRAPGRAELDVTLPEGVEAWFRALPRCDVLVNNAGIVRDRGISRMSEVEWDEVMQTNLRGAIRCTKAVLPLMLRQGGGHIVQIGSFSALAGPAGQANYAAAKAALVGFSQSLALELGRRDIRVNVVLPGFLESRMTAALPETVREQAHAAHALGRFNTPAEAARFVVQLTGFEHISGQVFQLDSRVGRWC